MIKRSNFSLSLTRGELLTLIQAKQWTGEMWDKPPCKELKNVKEKIRSQLKEHQPNCAYCGLRLGGTSAGEVEHIAPKAHNRYPQFTFSLWNLVMACNYCNGFAKKSTKDTISVLNSRYKKCEFSIVHPYFDNPDDHYEWTDNELQVLISVKNNSTKAVKSLDIFELDSPRMSEFRAAQVRYEELANKFQLSDADEQLLQKTIRKQ